ncbi:Ceramide very long chain fatty acid hydroxylase SCS7 [Cyberlindnera fabianii]|uniref:Ceramide very long chain fatty acid hydroxylase n=1 Tax=Cyberlindnera fabianii TaxID=36022 RepID=A0A1V2L3S7_CYBFA|nr:Ceramide very long chain fatty acid hydroxylase SCS7 [Cyberlindnera fabianii]
MSTLPLISKKQLEKHNSEKDVWVSVFHRKVYNVTDFLDEHPGGAELITEWAGKDITEILAVEISHAHSETTYEILDENYLVGYLATAEEEEELLSNPKHKQEVKLDGNDNDDEEFDSTAMHGTPAYEKLSIVTDFDRDLKNHKFLDLTKPLLMQVLFGGFSKEFYLDQVHRPRHYGKGSAPLFGNFLEPLSLTPWWVVPTIWVPVNLYVFSIGLRNLNIFGAFALYGIGLFVWTLIEYAMHRFLFHLDDHLPDHPIALTVHFLLHGVHHYLPMDQYRLVMPPTLFVALCYPFYKLVFSILPYYWACCGFAGGFMGYIMYDCTHYILHHAKLPSYLQKLKKYHLEHHYKNYELGFGVTSWFWDRVFGTYLEIGEVIQKQN